MNFDAIEDEILELERQLRFAILTSDSARLGELLADEMRFVVPLGYIMTKEIEMDAHLSGMVDMKQFDFADQEVHPQGEDMVTTTKITMCMVYAGKWVEGDYQYVRVWRKINGCWQVVSGQCSLLS